MKTTMIEIAFSFEIKAPYQRLTAEVRLPVMSTERAVPEALALFEEDLRRLADTIVNRKDSIPGASGR